MTQPETFADALIDAQRRRVRIVPPKPWPETREEAFAVQLRVVDALGPVAGFKVVDKGDEPPLIGPILAGRVVESGAEVAVADRLGCELEVGFELVAPLPEGGFPADPARYFRPRPVLELVDTRLDGPDATLPLLQLADMQVNAGLVLGAPMADWDGSDFGRLEGRLAGGGETVFDGASEVPGGSALANLELFCRSVGSHCGGLRPGQVVITGSLCGLPWFRKGAEVQGWIAGLGEVSVRLS